MRKHITSFVAFAALALAVLAAPQVQAQSTHFDIELGYQWVDVGGDENLYRTQINQQSGFVLRGFSLNHIDSTGDAGFADNFTDVEDSDRHSLPSVTELTSLAKQTAQSGC